MTCTKTVAQMRIARVLHDAEFALDDALLKQCALLSELVISRRETGSPPFEGHEALLRLAKSQQTLLGAGGELARVHQNLLRVQLDVLGFERCPDNEPMGAHGLVEVA